MGIQTCFYNGMDDYAKMWLQLAFPFYLIFLLYRMAQNFGGRKLWRIAANKHFGGKNIGGLAALHSKVA